MAMMPVGAPRPDMMMPDNSRRGITISAATMEGRAGAKTAAAEYGAATAEATAMNGRTAAAETTAVKAATPETAAATAAEATASTATETATTAAAASDFSRQSVGGVFRGRHGTGIDQRQSLGALARRSREHQYRGSRKAQRTDGAADNAAPRIWNLHHA